MLGAIGNAVKYGCGWYARLWRARLGPINFDSTPEACVPFSLKPPRQPMHEVEGKLSIVDARTIHPKWHLVGTS